MTIEIKAPTFPESIADGTVAAWHKQPGEHAARDDVLVEIETDKVVIEVVAPADGTLKEVLRAEGDTVLSEEVIAIFVEGAATGTAPKRSSDDAIEESPSTAEKGKSKSTAGAGPAARKMAQEKAIDERLAGRGFLHEAVEPEQGLPAGFHVDAALGGFPPGRRREVPGSATLNQRVERRVALVAPHQPVDRVVPHLILDHRVDPGAVAGIGRRRLAAEPS
ncbi:MAG: hypothetical protein HC809_07920, partial [Gammaproteobacteria bacterium]|nr:hypothetical protein [Gammaproteobacteria bacterium]